MIKKTLGACILDLTDWAETNEASQEIMAAIDEFCKKYEDLIDTDLDDLTTDVNGDLNDLTIFIRGNYRVIEM